MKLINFTGGSAGVPVWINPEAVASVQAAPDPASQLTLITTQDGKEHFVQEALAVVVDRLQQAAGA
jgi:uncharacterized protein YlzI (FlbEa/FlbD family)